MSVDCNTYLGGSVIATGDPTTYLEFRREWLPEGISARLATKLSQKCLICFAINNDLLHNMIRL